MLPKQYGNILECLLFLFIYYVGQQICIQYGIRYSFREMHSFMLQLQENRGSNE